jgi:3-isopropylmalate/(R)-2-methylmalate dehydratase large subunit
MSAAAPPPRTLFEKIWDAHCIAEAHGRTLLYVDRNYVHEGSRHAFAALTAEGRAIRAPHRTIAFADHYVPTEGRPLSSSQGMTASASR